MRENISVCIASYNGADRIGRQLQSILRQLNEGDEVIIVDDCSSDKTVETIKSFHHPQVCICKHENNQGYVKSFEDAIAAANHDIVFLSDQDDEWMRNKIDIVVSLFADTNVGLVIHNAEVVDSNGRRINERLFSSGLGTNFINRHMLNSHNYGCCMAFRKNRLKFLLPFPSIAEAHDEWIAINADMNGCTVLFENQNLIKWIRYGDNATDAALKRRTLYDKILTRIKHLGLVGIFMQRRRSHFTN